MIKNSGGLFISQAAAQPRSHKIGIQQQHRSSSTTAAVSQALAVVPVVTVYACVVGSQHEIAPRQHFHVQCKDQTHVVGSQTRYTKHTAAAKAAAHTHL